MSSYWTWLIFTIMIQLGSQLLNPKGYQRGKLLTLPMRKAMPKMFDHNFCRLTQLWIVLLPLNVFLSFFIGKWSNYVYFILVIALSLDDYLTNDDNFKKWWMEARNKIKWKMKLPEPAPAGSKVGS